MVYRLQGVKRRNEGRAMRRIDCEKCGRSYYGIAEDFYPNLCPVCEDPDRHWCVQCGEEASEELHSNHYCEDCLPEDPELLCCECGEKSDCLIQDGETYGGDPWMVCPDCEDR